MTTNKIDWSELYRRMEEARRTFEAEPPPAERARILQERARALAREPEAGQTGAGVEVVEFLLAHEKYAVESAWVRDVVVMREWTPLPCTPAFIFGLANVRGQILTVLDLKKFFDLPERGLGDLNKIIILHSESMEFGILADAILGVRTLALAELQPAPDGFTGIRGDYLKGLTRERQILLDAGKLLTDERLLIRHEVM